MQQFDENNEIISNEQEKIYIYKHNIYNNDYLIHIFYFQLFNNETFYDSDNFQGEVFFNTKVKINESELYKYINSSEYYSDNCSNYTDELSLYERKKKYNDNNLFICQSNCRYQEYDNNTKSVVCLCHPQNSSFEKLIDKFELLEEDKYKCLEIIKISEEKKMKKYMI